MLFAGVVGILNRLDGASWKCGRTKQLSWWMALLLVLLWVYVAFAHRLPAMSKSRLLVPVWADICEREPLYFVPDE